NGPNAMGPEPRDDEFLDERLRSAVMEDLHAHGPALQRFEVQLRQGPLERSHHQLLGDARGLSRFRHRRERAAGQHETCDSGGGVAIAFAAHAPRRVDRLVLVDIGPEISEAGLIRVGTLMARSPELFTSLEHALAFHRVTNPLYTEAMLRHRVEHGTKPTDGGLTWKYDRGLRDAVRAGTWRDPIDLWPLWRDISCPILLVRGADSDVLSAEIAKR